MSTPSLRSLQKAFDLLRKIVESGEEHSVSDLAVQLDMPRSTAFRIAATLERSGLLTKIRRGYYLPGPGLLKLAKRDNLRRVLIAVGRPTLEKLAKRTGCVAHLGIFEDAMVTYLLKAGRSANTVFTREGTQLEAYCTGIGKVLLASLPEAAREDYLRTGPFVALTPTTLTDPNELREALVVIAKQGYAIDNAEMDTDLTCLAVPLRSADGEVIAAISVSQRRANKSPSDPLKHLESLRAAAAEISAKLEPRTASDE